MKKMYEMPLVRAEDFRPDMNFMLSGDIEPGVPSTGEWDENEG